MEVTELLLSQVICYLLFKTSASVHFFDKLILTFSMNNIYLLDIDSKNFFRWEAAVCSLGSKESKLSAILCYQTVKSKFMCSGVKETYKSKHSQFFNSIGNFFFLLLHYFQIRFLQSDGDSIEKKTGLSLAPCNFKDRRQVHFLRKNNNNVEFHLV